VGKVNNATASRKKKYTVSGRNQGGSTFHQKKKGKIHPLRPCKQSKGGYLRCIQRILPVTGIYLHLQRSAKKGMERRNLYNRNFKRKPDGGLQTIFLTPPGKNAIWQVKKKQRVEQTLLKPPKAFARYHIEVRIFNGLRKPTTKRKRQIYSFTGKTRKEELYAILKESHLLGCTKN